MAPRRTHRARRRRRSPTSGKALLEDLGGRPGPPGRRCSRSSLDSLGDRRAPRHGFTYSSSVLPAKNPLFGDPTCDPARFRWPNWPARAAVPGRARSVPSGCPISAVCTCARCRGRSCGLLGARVAAARSLGITATVMTPPTSRSGTDPRSAGSATACSGTTGVGPSKAPAGAARPVWASRSSGSASATSP